MSGQFLAALEAVEGVPNRGFRTADVDGRIRLLAGSGTSASSLSTNSTRVNAGVRDLKRWLRGRAELAAAAGRPIKDIRCIRTSSSNVTQWEASGGHGPVPVLPSGERALEIGRPAAATSSWGFALRPGATGARTNSTGQRPRRDGSGRPAVFPTGWRTADR